MKKLLLPLLILGLVFSSCEQEDLSSVTEVEGIAGKAKKAKNTKAAFDWTDNDCDPIPEAELYAGQHELVGKVIVEVVGENYEITYALDAGYCLKETHLSVVDDPEKFPMSGNGNPPPGQFEYKGYHDCVSSFTYEVPTSKGMYIAAHAVVNCVETYIPEIPETVDICTKDQGPDAYLNISINGGESVGTWCVDNDLSIELDKCYFDVPVYSSLGTLPSGAFEYPDNFDLVNWLLNQSIVGSKCAASGGLYTYGDLQLAIWNLLDDVTTGSIAGLGEYSEDCVNELIALAEANGEGFTPDCGDFAGVILMPTEVADDGLIVAIQPLLIPYPVECKEVCSETAWARNQKDQVCGNFPGSNWATYFVFGYVE
ncbi:MAG: hypothetical protein KJN96_08510 [Eudoraea sp.]|nr:hypothetical protein [Eudoraea sp.]